MSQPIAGSGDNTENLGAADARESAERSFDRPGAEAIDRLQRILAEFAVQSSADKAPTDVAHNLAALASLANQSAGRRKPDERRRFGAGPLAVVAASNMRRGAESEMRAELSQKLDELNARLGRRAGDDNGGTLRAALTELEARLQIFAGGKLPASQGRTISDPASRVPAAATAVKARQNHALHDAATRGEGTAGKIRPLTSVVVDAAAFTRMQQQTEEIRDLLANAVARPLTIDKIEAQLDTLTQKAEEAIAKTVEPLQYDSLSHHIESSHRQLTAQFEAGLAGASAAAGGVKELIQTLSDKIESAQDPKANDQDKESLRGEIATIAKRLDGAEAGFASLMRLEQSIATLMGRFAVPSILRDPGVDPDKRMAAEMTDPHAARDEADRRVQLALSAVQETVGQVAERLSRMEADLGEMRSNHLGPLLGSNLAPIFAPNVERRRNGGEQSGHFPKSGPESFGAESAFPGSFDRVVRQQPEHVAENAEKSAESVDFLIEPGSGFQRRGEHTGVRTFGDRPALAYDREGGAGRADFIAAARRAAQDAPLEAIDAHRSAEADDDQDKAPTRIFDKRAVVLGGAALCLAMCAYALAKLAAHGLLSGRPF